jgi:hypothetical protein
MYANELKNASRERLMQDLRNVASDLDLYLSASAGEADKARRRTRRAEEDARGREIAGRRNATQCPRRHP